MQSLIVIIFLTLCIVVSCSDNKKPITNFPNKSSNDFVIKKRIIHQRDGKIRHAIYFLVRNADTSNLRYDFFQNSADEIEITLYSDKILNHSNLSYREEMRVLKQVLSEAAKDFDLRSIKRIWDIPLLITGDLAIAITKQLPHEYLSRPLNNLDVANFLLTSKLTDDLNELFRPYGKKIKRYDVEKAGFLDSSIIFKYNKIETPKSEIPSKLLDAQIWPVIENKRPLKSALAKRVIENIRTCRQIAGSL